MTFKPMLAVNADLDKIKYPVLVTPKFDGIRCVILDGKPVTRTLKPIPNDYIRQELSGYIEIYSQKLIPYAPFDGELIVGDPTAKDCFQVTTSAVMSRDGKPEFTYYVFDLVGDIFPGYQDRAFKASINAGWYKHVKFVEPLVALNRAQLLDLEEAFLLAGYEGIIIRDPKASYKYGRSTAKEGGMLKLKRFTDTEATLIGMEELEHNDNAITVNALGNSERSSHKANKRAGNTLGALVVDFEGSKLRIGTGFTAEQRKSYWLNQTQLLGKIVKFKYQEVGTKDIPRLPVFLGFRDPLDL